MPEPTGAIYLHLICLGACILATAYHSVLYIYYRDKLLLHYVAYLACMCLFIFIRSDFNNFIFGDEDANDITFYFNEGLQVFYFILYINFGAQAIQVPSNKKSFVYKGWVLLSMVLTTYAVLVIVLHLNGIVLPVAFFLTIRIFIFAMSFTLLWRCFAMPVSTFQLWILSGCIYFFICGLMSFLSNTTASQQIIFDPVEWLQVGNFGEILFFSSAMGYRLKKVNDERQIAINLASEEKAIAQQLRFEKTKDIIQTRLDERNRIARDMHDDLGSGLTKIAILSEVAKRQLLQPEKAKIHLENISISSRELVDNLQDIIWVLNPANDTLESLAAYIREYALKFFEPFETDVIFNYPDEIPDIKLTEEQRRNLFLVLKESFNNIAKHAWCNKVTLHLIKKENAFSFIIEDDGKGFNINDTRQFGNGLQNTKNRMLQIDGEYEIKSAPGKGTSTSLSIFT